MGGELEKILKSKKAKAEKIYLCMWMEGENIKLTPKRIEGKFQFNVTPKDGQLYHLLKALWDYESASG